MKFAAIAGYCLTLLSPIALATDISAMHINDAVDGVFEIGGTSYQLPPGEWRVVSRSDSMMTSHAAGDIPVANALFVQKKGGNLIAMLRFVGNEGNTYSKAWTSDPCGVTNKNTYFKETFSSSYSMPECLFTKAVTGFLTAPGGYWGDAARWLETNQVKTPATAIVTDYSYYNGKGFVHVSFWFDPDVSGIKSDPTRNYSESNWFPNRLDDKKKSYLAKLEEWSRGMAVSVRKSYRGDLVAIPQLPE
ncbi:hypothetical protein OL229_02410 [Neisseriaceae bacterium JH1-16]|nr:hypothetical protein [Neisseriaceae bacterium JH1-16]